MTRLDRGQGLLERVELLRQALEALSSRLEGFDLLLDEILNDLSLHEREVPHGVCAAIHRLDEVVEEGVWGS